MTLNDSPTRLVLEASGAPTRHSMEMEHAGNCAMCGLLLEVGDRAEWFDAPKTFCDYNKLAFPESPHLCPYCAGAYARGGSPYYRAFTEKHCRHIAVEGEGLFSMVTNLESVYWLLNPPKKRWAAVIKTAMHQQHIWWLAAVNEPGPIGQIQFGPHRMVIRFPVLRKVTDACHRYREKFGKNPFVNSRDLDNPAFGVLPEKERRPEESVLARDPELYSAFYSLTLGERWALNRTAFIPPEEVPEKPSAPINLKGI